MRNAISNTAATNVPEPVVRRRSGYGNQRGRQTRGQTMVEFALCLLLFMAVVLGSGQIGLSSSAGSFSS